MFRHGSSSPSSSRRSPLRLRLVALAALGLGLLLWLAAPWRAGPAVQGRGATAAAAAIPSAELRTPSAAAVTANALAPSTPRAAVGGPGPGVRLAGRGRLEGRAVELVGGAPVADAEVRLLSLPPALSTLAQRALDLAAFDPTFRSRVLPIATARTDADGHFAFAAVREGRYFLEARGERHVPHAAEMVRVTASGQGGPVVVFLRQGGGVRGQVVDVAGNSVGRGTVALYQGTGGALEAARRGDAVFFERPVGSDGRFEFAGVPPGEGYELSVHGSGLVLSHAADLAVRAGAVTEARVVLREGGRVRGRVLAARGAEGSLEPAGGALVAAVPRGLRDLGFVRAVVDRTLTHSAADGGFELRGVPPGEVDVVAWLAGLHPGHRAGLSVAPGGLAEAGELELQDGPLLRGTVVDGSGAPLAGVRVRYELVDWRTLEFDFSLAPLLYQAVDERVFPVSDAAGRFTAGPFPGRAPHDLFLLGDGFALERRRYDPERDGAEVTFRLSRGGAVEGIVLDAETAAPVTSFGLSSSARIDLRAEEPSGLNPFAQVVEVEHPEGRFRLEPLRAGSLELSVTAPGYLPFRTAPIELEEGGEYRGLVVALERGLELGGRVVDGAGAPVPGARVVPLDGRGRPLGPTGAGRDDLPPTRLLGDLLQLAPLDLSVGLGLLGERGASTDAEGRFLLRGLPAGTLRLLATERGHAPTEGPTVELAAGAPAAPVEIVLRRGGSLVGRVLDRFGEPVAGALVFAATPPERNRGGRGGLYQGRSGADGRYAIEAMAPGSYVVSTTRADEAQNPLSFLGTLTFDLVTVPGEGQVELDLLDSSAAATRVFGTVRAGGVALGNGALFAADYQSDNLLGVDFKVARVGGAGEYQFPGLAPGDYRFTYQNGDGEVTLSAAVPDAPEFRLDLDLPAGRLGGRVLADDSGEPVRGAEVLLRRRGDDGGGSGLLGALLGRRAAERSSRTAADGSFVFEAVEAGDYRLVVRGPRSGPERQAYASSPSTELSLGRAEERLDLEVRLVPSAHLAGRVLDPRGQGLAEARVWCVPRGSVGARVERATSGADGRFELGGLGAGEYELIADHAEYAEGRALVTVRSDAPPEEVELRLDAGTEVTVAVTSGGRPAPGALVRLARAEQSAAEREVRAQADLEGVLDGRGVTDAAGRVALGRVAAGSYRLEVTRGSQRATEAVLELELGPPQVIPVELRQ
jgi:hypothetical protein